MAYYNELSFASKYYSIDENGVVTLKEDTPEDIKRRFWKEWVVFRIKVIEMEKNLHYSSKYPFLPITDEDPNKPQYEGLYDD